MKTKKRVPLGAQLALAHRAHDNIDRCACCCKELPPEPRYCDDNCSRYGPWDGKEEQGCPDCHIIGGHVEGCCPEQFKEER